MGQVFDFRPFQSAAKQARRVGIPQAAAVREVLAECQRGANGNAVQGRYRQLAAGRDPDPRGAA